MTTQRIRAAKKIKVNLNYLRNDLDIWHHRLISWLDGKSQPQQNEIEKFGIEVVQKLCKREVLKKKDIYGMKFPERPLTPRRSRSDSPNRPTTPSDCQKKLDFNDDEDSYKVEADISHASCTCANNEVYYKCRISLLEKQKVELEKELQRTAKNEDFELSANEYVNKFRDLKNKVDSKHIDGCPKCTFLDGHTQRYRAERNELREDNQRLENMLTRLTGERNDHGRKLRMLEYEKAKLAENNKSLETQVKKSKQYNQKLQRDQDDLQDNVREKANELKESDVRLRKLEADIIVFHNTKTENEQLKELLREVEGVKKEFEHLEKRYKKETSDRMSSDNITTKYKEDNDRLRKERNATRLEMQRVLKENKESYQNPITERVIAREELQNKEREKSELVALFKDKEDKDLQKMKLYEKEIETLKSRREDDNDKLQRLAHDIGTLKSRNKYGNDKMRHMECEIETLKSRLSIEGSDQTLGKIGKGSIIRAQTMINYDKLFTEKSEEVTKKVSELYENKWKVAMIELGENGDEKKHIEFLLKIFENAYSFCESMEERFTKEFEQAMLNASANIKEVVDTALFVRPILERLERCINQMFLREYGEYQEYRAREHVHTYITESLSLSWFMVTRNPRVSISTTIPNESNPQFYDTYSTDGSEVDYVVLPMVKWSTNKNEIIHKGIAAFK